MDGAILKDLRTWRFVRRLGVHASSGLGALALLVGLTDAFFVDELSRRVWILWALPLVALSYGFVRAWPRPISQYYASPSTSIRVVRDDLFSDSEAHLVIGVCDTFDTMPPHIAPNSVQGQFLARLYRGDAALLDSHIDAELTSVSSIGSVDKAGKQVRYPVGTVIALRERARRYFLVAYTTMDNKNTASATIDGIWSSLGNLWSKVREESNGTAVRIPVIGGGLSKLSPVLPAQDAIRLIALSYMFASRIQNVCDELVIVATPKDYDRLDLLEIQSFLSSLRPS